MKNFIISLKLILILIFFCSFFYPLTVFLIGQTIFPKQANGSLIKKEGKIIGSKLIAQQFTSRKYFHPRPSSCNYQANNSSSSNLPLISKEFQKKLLENQTLYRQENQIDERINLPFDAITSSASGLDPHISLQNAYLQTARVAKERNISYKTLVDIVEKECKNSFFGESTINVLLLNLLLDEKFP